MKRIILSIFVIMMTSTLVSAESCSNVGKTDKKYTPQGDCDYKTETRTCCENRQWSEWNKECENHDGLCWNGHEYRPKPSSALVESGKVPPGLASIYCNDPNCSTTTRDTSLSMKIITPLKYEIYGDCKCVNGKGWDCPYKVVYTMLYPSYRVLMGQRYSKNMCGSWSTEQLAGMLGINLRDYWEGMPYYVFHKDDNKGAFNVCKMMYSACGMPLGRDYREGGSLYPLTGGGNGKWIEPFFASASSKACKGGRPCNVEVGCQIHIDTYILSESDKDYLGLR